VTTFLSALRRGSQQRRYDAVDAGWSIVLAAAVTGSFGLLTVVVSQFRKENRRDHDVVMGMLKYINKGINRTEIKLDKVSEKVSDHLENHPK
jgi:hypothetical protein